MFKPLDNPNKINHDKPIKDVYDFIIVGGGTAGAVLAARLSEDRRNSVLLLEAGDVGTAYTEWPMFTNLVYGSSRYDWRFVNVKDDGYCVGLREETCKLSRGKMLGGMSAFGRLMYVRGNKNDFDLWEQRGNAGWGYRHVLPYFIRSEDNQDPHLRRSPYHGVGGSLKVSNPRHVTSLAPIFLKSAADVGFHIGDINGESQSRFMLHQTTTLNAERWSTARGFLRPASHRDNLNIVVRAHVTRVIIDPRTRRAKGVEFFKHKKRRVAWARKEVVVSAGAFQSPHLLKLSGVGPCNELKKFGIRCLHDLPGVGENMQSHFGLGGVDFVLDKGAAEDVKDLLSWKRLLTSNMALEATGFVSSRINNDSYHMDWPDLQLLFLPEQLATDGGKFDRNRIGISKKLWKRFAPYKDKPGYRIVPVNLRPRSRGRVLLRSGNPFQHPDIFLNLFDDPHDLAVLREGGRLAERIGLAPPFLRLGARLNNEKNPFCYRHPAGGPDWWDCRSRVFPESMLQETSTCAMGPPDDHYAVVDNQLRVYGVSGLRVVDASVMPTITSGDAIAATIMIAERAADFIKAYWYAVHKGVDPAHYVSHHLLQPHYVHGDGHGKHVEYVERTDHVEHKKPEERIKLDEHVEPEESKQQEELEEQESEEQEDQEEHAAATGPAEVEENDVVDGDDPPHAVEVAAENEAEKTAETNALTEEAERGEEDDEDELGKMTGTDYEDAKEVDGHGQKN
ncbi:glucose dehydrogenase [FAD, quinone]-like [Pollicipes pollicipes]|uniref:glucose dehydrogenase [FAD, quinone]-like n=1 Tax=Pollicipes pollicipes TaxID=41117 RepID=UPI0018856FBC|nr:glucose dehydrogenase [FAD, quinone]-like [Pollicipes pollicipes]